MKNLELFLAILSGLLGAAAVIAQVRGYSKAATILGGVGLILCNVVWILRLT